MNRRSIGTRYTALIVGLLSAALIAGGVVETWSSHRDHMDALATLHRERARAAATDVSRFLENVRRNVDWATLSPVAVHGLERHRLDFLKLLRLEPAITTAALLDGQGRELLRISRVESNRIGSNVDRSSEPGYAAARSGRASLGEVFFVAQSEPYLTLAAPGASKDGSVVLADVNLKFVHAVVSAIKAGATGYAYVVDGHGRLVSHPDLSLVLKMTDLATLPQVQAARTATADALGFVETGRDLSGGPVLAAYARVAASDWIVFVEQPRAEAVAPLTASIHRSAAIVLVALLLAVAAGIIAARRVVAPIEKLRLGALRFGAGDLDYRIDASGGDELAELAAQFNAMAGQLRQSYAELEQRVAERTRDLDARNREITEALEQQTATAEILEAISSSPTDAKPVFETIVKNAASLCNASFAIVKLHREGLLELAASTPCTAKFKAYLMQGKPADRASVTGRAALERKPVQVLDFLNEPGVMVSDAHRSEEVRTVLAVPMLADNALQGVIAIWRREVKPFSPNQIKLLETFAAQAVIAIENLRLFEKIQETSRQLDLANQAKSRLLAAASHDLRQPMHALSLLVGQLRASPSHTERAELTERIEEAVSNLSELLDQLLDLSQLEAGAVQVEQHDFPVRELLGGIETQFASQAAAKGLELRIRGTSAWMRSDPLLVQRILINLVSNAIRYTESGTVLVGCSRRGDRLRIAVWDTGPGIPVEQREHVFREFVRLDSSGHRRASGLGLGLAIVARLADLLDTRVVLRSQPGHGSMFAFEVPFGIAHERARSTPITSASLDGVFALVIDDDETARIGTSRLLERWGCSTSGAAGMEAAIASLAADSRPPDLIVSDYRLGGGPNGLEAIERIRATASRQIAAILVTADTSAETLLAARSRGVPVLHKPVSPVKLRALLAQMLVEHPIQRAA